MIAISVCAVVAALAALSIYGFNHAATAIAGRHVQSACSRAITSAASECVDDICLTEEGERLYINSVALNVALNNVAVLTERYFYQNAGGTIEVPVSEFFGLGALTKNRACINFEADIVVACSPGWQLGTFGTNGYLYTLYIDVLCSVRYSCLFGAKTTEVEYFVPLAQHVFQDNIPECM